MTTATNSTATDSPWQHRWFVVFWLAMFVSNVGLWMRDVASGWAMTTLSPSPVMVAAVQAAATLPVLALALPAGAAADVFDRRRLMVLSQVVMGAASALLALFSGQGRLSAELLLMLTVVGGVGAALAGPAWQSMVTSLVPQTALRSAIALNSAGFNLARAVGPAMGGAVVAAVGAWAAYALDALSYVAVIAALLAWQPLPRASSARPERFGAAMITGLRYAANSASLRSVLSRAALFFAFASAYWALLPLVARRLGGGPELFGMLFGAAGLGALGGALLVSRLGARLTPARWLLAANLATGVALVALALTPDQEVALAAMTLAGAAWLVSLTTLNLGVQSSLPDWVRARGVALYLMVFNGSMAAGSLAWGLVASSSTPAWALVTAAGLAVLSSAAAMFWPLELPAQDLRPADPWPMPTEAASLAADRGPVMVTVTYRIDPPTRGELLSLLAALSAARRRDGAYDWGLYEEVEDPTVIREHFLVRTWHEHEHQHHRVTLEDAHLHARVAALLAPHVPQVRHALFIAV